MPIHDAPPPGFDTGGDATRRTWLATERTWLAWVRTGLTSTAVALGVGRLVPSVAHVGQRWPYSVVGAGYGLLGAALLLYGFRRRSEVEDAIERGRYATPDPRVLAVFGIVGALLALGTVALVFLHD